jgi:hypothetical protein
MAYDMSLIGVTGGAGICCGGKRRREPVEVHLDEGHAHDEAGDEAQVRRAAGDDQQADEHEHQKQHDVVIERDLATRIDASIRLRRVWYGTKKCTAILSRAWMT